MLQPWTMVMILATLSSGQEAAKAPRTEETAKADSLGELLDMDRRRLASLVKSAEGAEAEHARALKVLRKLEDALAGKQVNLEGLRAEGKKDEATRLEGEVLALEQSVAAARKRLELAVKEQTTLQQILESLRGRIQANEQVERKPVVPKIEAEKKDSKEDARLIEAREQARLKKEEAKKAQAKTQSVAEQLDSINREIDASRTLLNTARERIALARQRRDEIIARVEELRKSGGSDEELNTLARRVTFEEKRLNDARTEERSALEGLTQLQTDLGLLQAKQLATMQEAAKKRQEADHAELELALLENPFAWRSILCWLVKHGPRVLMLLVVTILLQIIGARTSRKLAVLVAQRETNRRQESEGSRAETLAGVLRHSLSILICTVGGLMILDEAGIPVGTLLGGAAVVGLAVSFGAQNLVKDYFSGFMILMEDQYGVGDWIKINGLEGSVEHLSLRVTSLRDLAGQLHFIPHGTIGPVTNMTHGWARALLEIPIAYKEDPDRVMPVLMEVAREVRDDPQFGPMVLGDPEMLGVNEFADSAVTIKFMMRTRPARQWQVQRELLRRIKHRFNELGIEIPFPQRTVYHRVEADQKSVPFLPRIERAA